MMEAKGGKLYDNALTIVLPDDAHTGALFLINADEFL